MIEHLNALQRAGVACVKIEGRMKKPEYVAAVTRCYRAALDGADASTIARLKQELFAFLTEATLTHRICTATRLKRIESETANRIKLPWLPPGKAYRERIAGVRLT